MRICHSGRFVFYSIPKTGSESMRRWLDPVSEEPVVTFRQISPEQPFYSHMRPVELRRIFAAQGRVFADYLHVSTVRNPWTRAASLWRMMRRDRDFGPCPGFRDWVLMLAEGQAGKLGHPWQRWYHHGLMSQSRFLSDDAGDLMVDRVFRLEDGLEPLRSALQARLSAGALIGDVPHLNRAPGEAGDPHDPETRRLVAEVYRADLLAFGYG